jgi:hypothetical protein
MSKSFVYDGVEVTLTGRKAKKDKVRRNQIISSETIVEIAPKDKDGPTWKRWVRTTELYEIIEDSKP